MITIAFHFNANRYHSTQWGRHVNEGVPEWPPSPWRILRSLVAVWQRTLPDLPANEVTPILEQLAAAPPGFYLPPATTAHTRHYMPTQQGRSETKTLVLDSFVAVQDNSPVYAVWPDVELTAPQRDHLAALLDNLGYLGRAEAWCIASLADQPPALNCEPLQSPTVPPGDLEVVRVLVPKQPLKLRDLCVETSELRGQRQIDPPGAEWRLYARPSDAFAPRYTSGVRQQSGDEKVACVARYALAGTVMPLAIDTLRVADLMRQCAMSWYGRRNNRAPSQTLSGKDAGGAHLKGHRHAFYLPTDEDQDGYLDHLTVWSPGGLDQRELEALACVDALNPGQGRPAVQLALLGYGSLEDFHQASGILPNHPIFGRGRVWQSITPFVLVRHPKKNKDGPADQVMLELERHGFPVPEPANIVPAGTIKPERYRELYPLEFYRWRRAGSEGVGGAYVFQVSFNQEVGGPLALGYGCHFGLGLFAPVNPSKEE